MNTISNNFPLSASYAAQAEKIPSATDTAALKAASVLDTYQRADGSIATRNDLVKSPADEETEPIADENEKKFREVLHQFVGQTLFGQMLKSMRANQEKNPYFDGGRAEEIFQGQLDMLLTDEMTKASSKSLSDPMYKLMTAKRSIV